MGFEKVIYGAWRDNRLLSASLELTYRCNLDCVFCYNDRKLPGTPLSTAQYLSFLEDLREMQVLNLILSGGEPLAHPDFFTLGNAGRELGFVIRLKSNGHGLRGEVARRVKDEVDPFIIDLSLHGAHPESHDRQTRVAGSFERLLQNIPEMKALGLRLKLNATLTRWNETEAEGMLAIADHLGVPITINTVVSPRDDGDREPLELTASRQARLDLFRLLARRAREKVGTAAVSELASHADDDLAPVPVDKTCGAGSSGVTVDPYGNVLPCVQWRRPVGNLHQASIREIWAESQELREVRELTRQAKGVVDGLGELGRGMSFCAGLANAETGDPLALYNSARETAELLAQVKSESPEASARRERLPVVG
jgi:MoaA/NifB/PqqE/SkfB family radical SAM enzyme